MLIYNCYEAKLMKTLLAETFQLALMFHIHIHVQNPHINKNEKTCQYLSSVPYFATYSHIPRYLLTPVHDHGAVLGVLNPWS